MNRSSLKQIATRSVRFFASHFSATIGMADVFEPSALHELKKRAARESADFIETHLKTSLLFPEQKAIWDHALKIIEPHGLLLEFGVYKAKSLNYFSSRLETAGDKRTWYGFDSFRGLAEDWQGTGKSSDHFDLQGNLPAVNTNVKLIPGWIDETFPRFLSNRDETIAFMHIDTDTYSPAKTVLELSRPNLKRGSLVLFDEFLGYPGWKEHEFKAFHEIFSHTEVKFIAFTRLSALIQIL